MHVHMLGEKHLATMESCMNSTMLAADNATNCSLARAAPRFTNVTFVKIGVLTAMFRRKPVEHGLFISADRPVRQLNAQPVVIDVSNESGPVFTF